MNFHSYSNPAITQLPTQYNHPVREKTGKRRARPSAVWVPYTAILGFPDECACIFTYRARTRAHTSTPRRVVDAPYQLADVAPRRIWLKGLANVNASHDACTDLSRGRKVGISQLRVTSCRCAESLSLSPPPPPATPSPLCANNSGVKIAHGPPCYPVFIPPSGTCSTRTIDSAN